MTGYLTKISTYAPDAYENLVKTTTIQCDKPANPSCIELASSVGLSNIYYTRPFDILTQIQGTLKYYNNGTPVMESGIFNRFSGSSSGSKSTFILKMQ